MIRFRIEPTRLFILCQFHGKLFQYLVLPGSLLQAYDLLRQAYLFITCRPVGVCYHNECLLVRFHMQRCFPLRIALGTSCLGEVLEGFRTCFFLFESQYVQVLYLLLRFFVERPCESFLSRVGCSGYQQLQRHQFFLFPVCRCPGIAGQLCGTCTEHHCGRHQP